MEGDLKCRREIGCHACPLAFLQEDLRMFRHALVQFMVEPPVNGKRLQDMARSMKTKIDTWIEPREDTQNG